MRVTDLLQIAETYGRLGVAAAALMAAVSCVWYFVVYRKILHGTAAFPIKKIAAAAVILCYLIVVLGATMLERGGIYGQKIDLTPFIAYRRAWNDFSIKEWRNIILNILMFVPFGLLLPFYGRWWCRPACTYLAGLAFTLLIESAQLILKRGIFEVDDIFNNLLGTMIGYGIYRLLHDAYSRRKAVQSSFGRTMLFQLPLVFTAALFGIIFTVYRMQEFGNLSVSCISRVDMSSVDVRLNTALSDERAQVPVYQMPVVDEAETREMAQAVFERLGTQLDVNENDIYDETAVYWSTGREYNIWIDFAGAVMRFTDFNQMIDQERITAQSGCGRDEVQNALADPYGIVIPEGCSFEEAPPQSGRYIFTVSKAGPDMLCEGSISCQYNSNGKISSFDNRIITYEKYRECSIQSEQEAFDRLKKGYFRQEYYGGEVSVIEIDAVRLGYVSDSKGFYQPVYDFAGTVNGEEYTVQIPAIK